MDGMHFDYQKSTQVLNYFALKSGGKINKMKVLKLIYFADRYHLRKYGRLITNDDYVAMKHGPVPSSTKDIAESNDFLDNEVRDYALKYIEPINNLILESINTVDTNVLSTSDVEALQYVWEKFGKLNQFQLRDLTHKYPEWKIYEDSISDKSCIPMSLSDFIKDPEEDIDKCFELDNDDKAIRTEQIEEMAQLKSLWR